MLLKKKLKLEVTPRGNPAMPMKLPFGPKGFQNIYWPNPQLITNNVRGFDTMATA